MTGHFCNCPDKSCAVHPINHDSGCDPCIKKNLDEGEIPACFWAKAKEDLPKGKYSIESFVEHFLENRKASNV